MTGHYRAKTLNQRLTIYKKTMFAGQKNNSKILSAGALFLVKVASWEKMLLTRTEWH